MRCAQLATGLLGLLLVGIQPDSCLAGSGAFVPDDIYLVTKSYPDPDNTGLTISAVVRIEPATWSKSITYSQTFLSHWCTYDASRDRIIMEDPAGGGMLLIAADGSASTLATPYDFDIPAAVGNGRIYLHNRGSNDFAIVEGAGLTLMLLDQTGLAEFEYAAGDLDDLMYHPETNSLIAAVGGASITLLKIPLSCDGLQVSGPIVTNSADLSPGSFETGEGLSFGPGGSIFLKIDDNSNSAIARMQTFDPVTLAMQTYATSSYFGVGGEVAGVYSSLLNRAVVLDSFNNVLKEFSFGETSEGSVVLADVSSGGSGEDARLIVIPSSTSSCPGDANGDDIVDIGDLNMVLGNFSAGACGAAPVPGDVNGDGAVDIGDLNQVLGNFGANCL